MDPFPDYSSNLGTPVDTTPSNTPFLCPDPLDLFLLLLATAGPKQPTDIPARSLPTIHQPAAHLLAALSKGIDHRARRPADVATVFVLALPLGAVDALLGYGVPDGLEQAALADLAGHEVVHAVLEIVDGLDARDFGLAESICVWSITCLVLPTEKHGHST